MPVPTPPPAAQPKLSSSRRWIPVILGAMLLSGVALFLLPDPDPRHQGKSTARSIRTLLAAAGMKMRKRIVLEILE